MLNLLQAPVGQIAIVCEDVARARTFYKDTLGVRHLWFSTSLSMTSRPLLALSRSVGSTSIGTPT